MLANGDYIAGVIESIYGRSQLLCPAGCHPQPSQSLMVEPDQAFQGQYKIDDHTIRKPYVLITNRHEPQKKFEYVIESMAHLPDKTPDAQLVIPGPFTAHTPKLIELAEELGLSDQVLFLGQISESQLQRLYREAAVYCYPAPEEDFGMGVIEAMAWGVPVVAWDHAGPTVTVDDGISGFLAEPYQVESYTRAIETLLNDPKRRAWMGIAAHARAKNHFSWRRHVSILESSVLEAAGVEAPAEIPTPEPTVQPGIPEPVMAEIEPPHRVRG